VRHPVGWDTRHRVPLRAQMKIGFVGNFLTEACVGSTKQNCSVPVEQLITLGWS
jgi:hypothetical protein